MTSSASRVRAPRSGAFCLVAPALLLALGAVAGCGKTGNDDLPKDVKDSIKLDSTAFKEGETIPKRHTGDGKDTSPPLHWDEPPGGTKSFVLICDDPDAPGGTFTHWLLYNLPPDRRKLDEGVPAKKELPGGARQGKNDQDKIGYGGPAPPAGKPHRYYFRLYALDTKLDLPAGADRKELLKAMKGHELAAGQLMGRYSRWRREQHQDRPRERRAMAEKKCWVRDVKPVSTFPPAGTFTRDARTIARVMASKKVSPKGLGSGIRMIQFFINRAGKSLPPERKQELEKAKHLLQARLRKRTRP